MKSTTTRRVRDAGDACAEISGFIEGRSLEQLRQERILQLSVYKLLEIVGEALNKARQGESFVESRIPGLRRYVSLRNQIVHDYDKVDPTIIWQVVTEGVPDLRQSIEELLGSSQQGQVNQQGGDQNRQQQDGQRRPARETHP
jgi:uncharacterized protein with HEPN domain